MKTHRGRVHQDECRLVVRFYAILLFFIFLLNKSYYQKSLWFGPCTMSKKYLCQQLHTVWWFSKKCFPQLSLAVICRQQIKSLIFCWCIFMLAFESTCFYNFCVQNYSRKVHQVLSVRDQWIKNARYLVWDLRLLNPFTAAWSSASTNRFHKLFFFFSWQNDTFSLFFGPVFFFFFFSFFYQNFFRFWFFQEQRFFHKQRASTCEFYEARDANKTREQLLKRAPRWAVVAKIPLAENFL